MKKYTNRLKEHIHGWRVAKNWTALLIIIVNVTNTLIAKGSLEATTGAFGLAIAIVAFGETLHHLGMSWVETAESIQEKKNEII